ncbi:hypothetical protein ACFE04_019303 [Oxalis oulophora]
MSKKQTFIDSILSNSNDNDDDSNKNKPDFKELYLTSPSTPCITRATATSSSSSSSSGSGSGKTQLLPKNHSGELTGSGSRTGHRRSMSAGAPLIYSGSSFTGVNNNSSISSTSSSSAVSSNPTSNLLPSGNICPSGKILKTGMMMAASRVSNKTDTLRSGAGGHYGHGSIMRGIGIIGSKTNNIPNDVVATNVNDPEDVKKLGNEMYKKGNFVEALGFYDRAIALSPENAAYRSNRAAALTAMGRLGEAVKECQEAVRLDPGYSRAHQRLASIYLRLGQAENSRRHLCFHGQHPDPIELQKLQLFEKHLSRCADARKIGDWKGVLSETIAATGVGADSSPQLIAGKAEAYLKLHQIEDAVSTLSNIPKFDNLSSAQIKFCGMAAEAYIFYVHAQVDMAMGRFESAVSMTEKASSIEYRNLEIANFLKNVKLVARSRIRGNELFNGGNYDEACLAYGEGLKYDKSNSVLHCNRAVCWSKLGLWEKSVEDCNEALRIQPNYTKALLRRAASNGKLGRWAEAVRDYEVLRRELPGDDEIVENLLRAQVALKESRVEQTHTKKLGEVEELSSLEKFRAAITSPGVSVVHFKVASDEQCDKISNFVNMLCVRYPSIKFFKVDVEEILPVAKAESIRSVPTFKIYRNGNKLKEMICPSHQFLEDTVRNYCL